MTPVETAFSANGLLAKSIDGYAPRQAQIDMALEVEQVVENRSALIVEAGTGTGKTFAYLIPAFLSNRKVIVSTGTKNLQEQLFYRDIPVIQKAMANGIQVALLKGRANYLCTYRLDLYQQSRGQLDAQMLADYVQVKEWSTRTNSGDIGELVEVPEDSAIFPYVTSTVDNCLAKDCPNIEECYLMKARKKAIEADVVVVNHHLFFADMALKDTGFGELIPDSHVMIFDEAHQIPDIAAEYFGEHFSSRQAFELCKDIQAEYAANLRDLQQLNKAAMNLEKNILDMRLAFDIDPTRGNWRDKSREHNIQQEVAHVKKSFELLYDVMKLAISRSDAIDNCFDRLCQMKSKFEKVNVTEQSGFSYWYDTSKRHYTLHITPLSIADKFGEYVSESDASWIFTSATVSVDDKFDHFTGQLGLPHARTQILGSPFDYHNQAMLCVPRYFPEPNDKASVKAVTELALQLIEASNGRAFLLFTSHRVLRLVAEQLEDQTSLPILIQGSTSKRLLLEKFTKLKHAVLMGTSSFWEGVDVRGDTLSLVVIDKLPFASPDEPLLQARMEDCKLKGQDPFKNVQIPQAVITLKQGVGRLIRDVTDKGALVICDPRLVTRAYGEIFMRSLPPMRKTRDIESVDKFLRTL